MSPNLNHRPGSGPTEDEFENTRIIGLRQYDAAAKLLADKGSPIAGAIDHRLVHVEMSHLEVRPEFTGDGRPHRTGRPNVGAAALAGTRKVRRSRVSASARPKRRSCTGSPAHQLPVRAQASRRARPQGVDPGRRAARQGLSHDPDQMPVQAAAGGAVLSDRHPRRGHDHAGLRLRRLVAGIVGADVHNVLVAATATHTSTT